MGNHGQAISPNLNGIDHSKTMELTPYDQIMLRQITRFLLCFKIEQNTKEEDILDTLRKGLTKTVEQIPFLSGSVRYCDPHNMVKVVFEDSQDVPLRVVHLHDKMPDYETLSQQKIPLSELKEELLSPLPNFINPKQKKSQPILSLQANLLKGGLILCVCVHHSIVDGVGQGLLMNAFAANCILASNPLDVRAAETSNKFNHVVDEVKNRIKLFSDIKPEDILPDHQYEEYHIPDPNKVSPIDNVPDAPSTARLFFFTAAKLEELKQAIMESHPPTISDDYISTNDALGALAWHCVTSARMRTGKVAIDQSSQCVIPIDCRTHLQSAGLPKPYIGNACICLMPSLPMSEISPATTPEDNENSNSKPNGHSNGQVNGYPQNTTPLSTLYTLAQHIRYTITSLTTPYILGLAHHASTFIGDINTLKPRMQSYLGPDITYVSWASFKTHDLDFGPVIGTMDYFRCPYRAVDGVVKILPRGTDADWEVVVEMECDVMDVLLEKHGVWMSWVDDVVY